MINLRNVGAGLLALAASAGAQGDSRVTAVRDGEVRFTFALRPGVCGRGQGVWTNNSRRGSSMTWGDERRQRDVEYDADCDSGPGRIVVEKHNGEVMSVRFYVGGRWRANSTATDLGTLSTRDAVRTLLAIAEKAEGKAASDAIFPLTVVDSSDVWRDLMRIARDEDRPRNARSQAVFWIGQIAEEAATAGLKELVGEDGVDRDVREQAVFALSQRPKDEAVPALINIARTNRDPQIRRRAVFWLGQSNDRRALDYFEEMLTKR